MTKESHRNFSLFKLHPYVETYFNTGKKNWNALY